MYAREKAFMDDMSAKLLVGLSVRDTKLMHRVFDHVIDNGRVLRTVIQMIGSRSLSSNTATLPIVAPISENGRLSNGSFSEKGTTCFQLPKPNPYHEPKTRPAMQLVANWGAGLLAISKKCENLLFCV